MMLLNELTLRRFRIHENLTINLKAGVTGIIGRNGTGKSSIIEAIGFLFTGEADDPKEQVITAGSTGTAYVRGRFTLNGKEGMIERHLDSSKVLLEYDGQKLHKAGEVKEMWAKLLQVDSHIFQHVIMAKQKKIPELFSGETAVREKAFQRIFMVPNTEKLRSMVWTNYMKPTPPPLPEDDLDAIDRQIATLQVALSPKQEKLDLISSSVLSEHQMMAVVNYTEFYNKCIQDADKRPLLEAQEKELVATIETLHGYQQETSARLATYPADLAQTYRGLVVKQEQYRAYIHGKQALDRAEAELGTLTFDGAALHNEVTEDREKLLRLDLAAMVLNDDLEKAQQEQHDLSDLTHAPNCPRCKEPIKNIAEHIAHATAEVERLTKARDEALVKAGELRSAVELKVRQAAKCMELTGRVAMLRSGLPAEVEYEDSKLQEVENQQRAFATGQKSLTDINNALVRAEADLLVLKPGRGARADAAGAADPSASYPGDQRPGERSRSWPV